jgi:putative lipoic acid-binding regulatory protein
VDYPCTFAIKVIASAEDGSFKDEILSVVGQVCSVEAHTIDHSVRETKGGRYMSITLHAPVQSSEMLYSVYEEIRKDSRVKFNF